MHVREWPSSSLGARTAIIDSTGIVKVITGQDLSSKSECSADLGENQQILSLDIDEFPPYAIRREPSELRDGCSETTATETDHTTSSLDSLESPVHSELPSVKESEAIMDLVDHLDNVDESYMLSVYWNSGDTVRQHYCGESVGSGTMSSYASTTNSSATSMSSYTWTSSSRRRRKGAYHERSREVMKTPVLANWVDTMHESTTTLLGPLNKWSVSKGWENKDGQAWDPKADINTWGNRDPIFDSDDIPCSTEQQDQVCSTEKFPH